MFIWHSMVNTRFGRALPIFSTGKLNVGVGKTNRFTEVIGEPVLFKKTDENAIMPTKAHDDDFCYDCYAVSEMEIYPNVWKYGSGFALQIEDQKKPVDISRCFTFRSRSSICNTGMILSNGIGTIDNYTGEIPPYSITYFQKCRDIRLATKWYNFI